MRFFPTAGMFRVHESFLAADPIAVAHDQRRAGVLTIACTGIAVGAEFDMETSLAAIR